MEANQRILVVCDDPALLDELGKHLSEHGYDVRCASTAGEALARYADWPAELIVSETRLPDQTGLELAEAIGRLNPRARVILLTEVGEVPDLLSATRCRVIAHLDKPSTDKDLLYYVNSAFANSEGMQQNRREHNRYPFNMDTFCILINPFDNTESRPQAALMRDVSRSGVSMLVRQLLPVPAMLKLVFHLPRQQHPLSMLAKSVSCTLTQINGVYRLGARFIGLLPREMAQLLVNRALPSDSQEEDIYLGKSFKTAVHEWLTLHQQDFADTPSGMEEHALAELALQVSRDPDGQE